MVKNYILILIIAYLLGNCGQSNRKNAQLVIKETIEFRLPDKAKPTSKTIQFKKHNNKELLFYLDSYANRIVIYDVKTKNLIDQIEFEFEGPNGVGSLQGFYFKDEEHIYLTPKGTPAIIRANNRGKVIERLRYNTHKKYTSSFYARTHHPLFLIDSSLYFKQYPPSPYSQISIQRFSNSTLGLELNIMNGEVSAFKSNYPTQYWKDHKFLPYCSTTFNGKEIVHAFWYSRILYAYDIKTGKLREIDLSEHIPPFTYQSPNSPSGGMEYMIREPMLRSIKYDKYREVYYVFYYPGDEEIKIEEYDLYSLAYNKPHLILFVFDKNFTLLAKNKLPSLTYKMDNYFISEQGLYLSRNNVFNPDMKEDLLRFDLLMLTGK